MEVQHPPGSTARINLRGNSPQVYGYASPPVIPQGSHYGSSYQPSQTLSHQSSRSVTHHPPPSTRSRVPRDQSRGSSHRSRSDPGDPSRPSDLIPYNNPNSIERWAHGVTPGNTPTATLIGSDARSKGSTSHRSDMSRDRDRRRDKGGSRRGSTRRDRGNDLVSQSDGRSSRLDPNPNVTRKGSTTRGSSSHRSYNPSVTQR